MDTDSESQDSDEGRRFRFETTRKDAISVSQSRRKVFLQSPQRSKNMKHWAHSKNRNSRKERSKYSKDNLVQKNRLSNDRITNSKYSIKDIRLKDIKNRSRDSSSKREHNDSRNYRAKDFRSYDSREIKDSKNYSNDKHKSKSRDKHKKRSKNKSREKSDQITSENISKKEEKKNSIDTSFISMETEEVEVKKTKITKKKCVEDNKNVNYNNINKVSKSDMMNLTSTVGNTTVHPKKLKSFFDRIIHKQNHDANSSFYGPALSLELEKKFVNANDTEIPIKNIEKMKLPPYSVPNYNQNVIEPVLSKNHRQSSPITNNSIDTDKEKKTKKIEKYEIDTYNLEKQEIETFGPVLPPHMEKHRVIESVLLENIISSDNKVIDTPLRSNIEDDETFGPLPVDHPAIRKSYIQIQLEQRAKQVKAKFKDKISSEKRKREEWMVELPPTHAIALSFESRSRKFKMNEGSDLSDRSMWTDTPVDKYFKQTEKKEPLFVKSEESNDKLNKCKYEDVTKESVKQVKCESLLDMHLKSLKRKKKKLEKEAKEFGLSTRRPFDRDIDLQMNRLNDARKKNIFEKASCFNERFTPGKI